jgi:hypothetical protein
VGEYSPSFVDASLVSPKRKSVAEPREGMHSQHNTTFGHLDLVCLDSGSSSKKLKKKDKKDKKAGKSKKEKKQKQTKV